MKYQASDAITIEDFKVNDQGYLIAKGNLARTGIQEYYAHELGLDGDKNRKIKLYRPPEEVFSQDSMMSFENAPVTIGHPAEWVNPANWSQLAKGEAVKIDKSGDNYLVGDIIVKSQDAIDLIKKGVKQLSNGYSFELVMEPGKTRDGLDYDGIQKKIIGNHIAIVQSARCGSSCRIFDNEPNNIGGHMADRKMIIDGIPVEVNDTAAAAIDKLIAKVDDKEKEILGLNESIVKIDGDLKAINDAHKVEIEALKKQILTPEARDALVDDWRILLDGAAKLAPNVATKGKDCETIRREVLAVVVDSNDQRSNLVKAVVQDVKCATNDQLKSGFAVALAATDSSATAADNVGKHFTSGQQGTDEMPLTGRNAFLEKSANAWQGVKQ